MGRWDDKSKGFRGGRIRRNYVRIAKFVIAGGFIVVALVVLSVFIPRSGLNIEISERSEVMGTMQTISVRISNNNFNTLNDVTVQFSEQGTQFSEQGTQFSEEGTQFSEEGKIIMIGNMNPFSSVMITPDPEDLNFNKIIVKADNGEIEAIKYRQ